MEELQNEIKWMIKEMEELEFNRMKIESSIIIKGKILEAKVNALNDYMLSKDICEE